MPEHDCLPPDVSATEFVVHMARMSGLPPTAARERTADTLRHVGLYEERYRPIGGYSTGMKQRVKLAQALVHDPQLVLLDEPTNGLDPAGRDEMLGLIRRIGTEFGISVLVTSHLLGELERVCDHVVVIDGGRLLRSSATADVHRRPAGVARGRGRPRRTGRPGRRASRRAGLRGPRRTAGCSSVDAAPTTTTYDVVRDASPSSASAWSGWNSAGTGSPRSSDADATRGSCRQEVRCLEPPTAASSTTSATATTTAPGSAGRYAVRSLFVQSLRGGLRAGPVRQVEDHAVLLLAVMCCPRLIIVAVTAIAAQTGRRAACRLHGVRRSTCSR